jgi:hypothetical protein
LTWNLLGHSLKVRCLNRSSSSSNTRWKKVRTAVAHLKDPAVMHLLPQKLLRQLAPVAAAPALWCQAVIVLQRSRQRRLAQGIPQQQQQ